MMMTNERVTVYWCVKNPTEDEVKFIWKIQNALEKITDVKLDNVMLEMTDSYARLPEGEWFVSFGESFGNENTYVLPSADDMMSDDSLKAEGWNEVKVLAEELNSIRIPIAKPDSVAVEKEGITFGGIGADIQITTDDAEHLKKIRDLLGGGKMVITKGDLKIEVE
jgi:hypothetical protein